MINGKLIVGAMMEKVNTYNITTLLTLDIHPHFTMNIINL